VQNKCNIDVVLLCSGLVAGFELFDDARNVWGLQSHCLVQHGVL